MAPVSLEAFLSPTFLAWECLVEVADARAWEGRGRPGSSLHEREEWPGDRFVLKFKEAQCCWGPWLPCMRGVSWGNSMCIQGAGLGPAVMLMAGRGPWNRDLLPSGAVGCSGKKGTSCLPGVDS